MFTRTGAPLLNTVSASGSCLDPKTYVYGLASTLAVETSDRSAVHTWRPARPSTVKPLWFSKLMTAPLVITSSVPSVHKEVRLAGRPGQRQAKEPACGENISVGAGAGPLGAKESGR